MKDGLARIVMCRTVRVTKNKKKIVLLFSLSSLSLSLSKNEQKKKIIKIKKINIARTNNIANQGECVEGQGVCEDGACACVANFSGRYCDIPDCKKKKYIYICTHLRFFHRKE